MPANATSILQPMDQEVISTIKSYYFRKILCKAMAAIDDDSSYGSGQSKLKTFWKGLTILVAMKKIHGSWEDIKISTLIGVWKKLIPTVMGDCKEFKISVEEVTTHVAETARELKVQAEPEDVAELLQSHKNTSAERELLLMDERRKSFLETETIPGEAAVKIVEMTTKDLEYYVNSVVSNLKEYLLWVKCYQTFL